MTNTLRLTLYILGSLSLLWLAVGWWCEMSKTYREKKRKFDDRRIG